MYTKPFYIEDNIWNNALSFLEREKYTWKKSKLYVPDLKKIKNFSEVQLLEKNDEKITFQDFWFDDELSTNFWLENFYEMSWNWKKVFLFDNHNHAYYFWYLARDQWIIKDSSLLYHVDEHADYRDAWEYLMKPESLDMNKVFEYTNFSKVNVWNYIISAEKEWLVSETIQIRSEQELENYIDSDRKIQNQSIILNVDLDFFQPDLDFIDYEMKKKVVLDIAKKADVITVATSPFFIDQKLALEVFEDLFYKD